VDRHTPVPAYLSREELANRARAVVRSGRARERELRGMMRCGCGRKMGTRTAESKEGLFHYYVCKRSPAARKIGECAQRCVRATRVEDIVWRFVSELLNDSDRIKAGIEELIEQEREAGRDDPNKRSSSGKRESRSALASGAPTRTSRRPGS
jgi:hypothetical protein